MFLGQQFHVLVIASSPWTDSAHKRFHGNTLFLLRVSEWGGSVYLTCKLVISNSQLFLFYDKQRLLYLSFSFCRGRVRFIILKLYQVFPSSNSCIIHKGHYSYMHAYIHTLSSSLIYSMLDKFTLSLLCISTHFFTVTIYFNYSLFTHRIQFCSYNWDTSRLLTGTGSLPGHLTPPVYFPHIRDQNVVRMSNKNAERTCFTNCTKAFNKVQHKWRVTKALSTWKAYTNSLLSVFKTNSLYVNSQQFKNIKLEWRVWQMFCTRLI